MVLARFRPSASQVRGRLSQSLTPGSTKRTQICANAWRACGPAAGPGTPATPTDTARTSLARYSATAPSPAELYVAPHPRPGYFFSPSWTRTASSEVYQPTWRTCSRRLTRQGPEFTTTAGALKPGRPTKLNSLELDEFVVDHPDMLIVVAAGNDGTGCQPRFTDSGWVDLLIEAPATANALTVGASRSDRALPECPSWGQWWADDFPPPVGDEPISGDSEAMAAFSSRGPCDEQIRIKPDLVAPGTFILSTRSVLAPTDNFWAEAEPGYAYMGGTSVARFASFGLCSAGPAVLH